MPVFEYTALNASGKKVKGIIDADSHAAARQKIRGSGNYPINIKESVAKKDGGKGSIFTRQLGTNIKQQEIHLANSSAGDPPGRGDSFGTFHCRTHRAKRQIGACRPFWLKSKTPSTRGIL